MPRTQTFPTTREHGRNPWRVRSSALRDRAAAVYGAVPGDVRRLLPACWRADLRRAKSASCTASPLERTLEQVAAVERSGGAGFAELVCAAIRATATDTPVEQQAIALPVAHEMIESQRVDVQEDVVETEVVATQLMDRALVLRLADAKSRSALSEMRASAALRRHAETLPR